MKCIECKVTAKTTGVYSLKAGIYAGIGVFVLQYISLTCSFILLTRIWAILDTKHWKIIMRLTLKIEHKLDNSLIIFQEIGRK